MTDTAEFEHLKFPGESDEYRRARDSHGLRSKRGAASRRKRKI